MKGVYVVTHTVWKTGETKALAVFKSERLDIYRHLHPDKHQVKISKVPIMDGTPQMNRMVLEGKA